MLGDQDSQLGHQGRVPARGQFPVDAVLQRGEAALRQPRRLRRESRRDSAQRRTPPQPKCLPHRGGRTRRVGDRELPGTGHRRVEDTDVNLIRLGIQYVVTCSGGDRVTERAAKPGHQLDHLTARRRRRFLFPHRVDERADGDHPPRTQCQCGQHGKLVPAGNPPAAPVRARPPPAPAVETQDGRQRPTVPLVAHTRALRLPSKHQRPPSLTKHINRSSLSATRYGPEAQCGLGDERRVPGHPGRRSGPCRRSVGAPRITPDATEPPSFRSVTRTTRRRAGRPGPGHRAVVARPRRRSVRPVRAGCPPARSRPPRTGTPRWCHPPPPAADGAARVVDGRSGVRVGVRGHVGDHPAGTVGRLAARTAWRHTPSGRCSASLRSSAVGHEYAPAQDAVCWTWTWG